MIEKMYGMKEMKNEGTAFYKINTQMNMYTTYK